MDDPKAVALRGRLAGIQARALDFARQAPPELFSRYEGPLTQAVAALRSLGADAKAEQDPGELAAIYASANRIAQIVEDHVNGALASLASEPAPTPEPEPEPTLPGGALPDPQEIALALSTLAESTNLPLTAERAGALAGTMRAAGEVDAAVAIGNPEAVTILAERHGSRWQEVGRESAAATREPDRASGVPGAVERVALSAVIGRLTRAMRSVGALANETTPERAVEAVALAEGVAEAVASEGDERALRAALRGAVGTAAGILTQAATELGLPVPVLDFPPDNTGWSHDAVTQEGPPKLKAEADAVTSAGAEASGSWILSVGGESMEAFGVWGSRSEAEAAIIDLGMEGVAEPILAGAPAVQAPDLQTVDPDLLGTVEANADAPSLGNMIAALRLAHGDPHEAATALIMQWGYYDAVLFEQAREQWQEKTEQVSGERTTVWTDALAADDLDSVRIIAAETLNDGVTWRKVSLPSDQLIAQRSRWGVGALLNDADFAAHAAQVKAGDSTAVQNVPTPGPEAGVFAFDKGQAYMDSTALDGLPKTGWSVAWETSLEEQGLINRGDGCVATIARVPDTEHPNVPSGTAPFYRVADSDECDGGVALLFSTLATTGIANPAPGTSLTTEARKKPAIGQDELLALVTEAAPSFVQWIADTLIGWPAVSGAPLKGSNGVVMLRIADTDSDREISLIWAPVKGSGVEPVVEVRVAALLDSARGLERWTYERLPLLRAMAPSELLRDLGILYEQLNPDLYGQGVSQEDLEATAQIRSGAIIHRAIVVEAKRVLLDTQQRGLTGRLNQPDPAAGPAAGPAAPGPTTAPPGVAP